MINLTFSSLSRRHLPVLASLLILGTAGPAARAADITPGNLLVLRVNNTAALGSAAAAACFLDEYTPAGSLVQSFNLTTSGTNSFITSGSSGNDGQLSRSQDQRYILAAGYTSAPGTAAVAAVPAATAPRVVARIDIHGNVNTSTTLGGNFNASSCRWAASLDGSEFWVGGANTGVVYATLGGGTLNVITNNDALVNTRAGEFLGNTLYVSTGSGSLASRISSWGDPTTAGSITLSNLTGIPTSGSGQTGFAFVSVSPTATVKDTLYLTDTAAIDKYVWNGSTWTEVGTIPTVGAVQAYGITAIKVPGSQTVDIYYTAGSTAGNTLQHIQDTSGFGGTMNGTAAILATATNDTTDTPNNVNAFRGLIEAPSTPTLVDMLTFGATANGTDITVTWTTQSESATVGFNVWRSTASNGQFVKVNANLIPAVGGLYAGASYTYHDLVTAGQTYFYKLEDIDTAGVCTYQPAVQVTASANRTPTPTPPRPVPVPRSPRVVE